MKNEWSSRVRRAGGMLSRESTCKRALTLSGQRAILFVVVVKFCRVGQFEVKPLFLFVFPRKLDFWVIFSPDVRNCFTVALLLSLIIKKLR